MISYVVWGITIDTQLIQVGRILPGDPLILIKRCVKNRKIHWAYHVDINMRTSSVPRQYIINSFNNYKILEEYPHDKHFPYYLVYSEFMSEIFHILFAVDIGEEGDTVRVITAYIRNPEEWDITLKIREQPW